MFERKKKLGARVRRGESSPSVWRHVAVGVAVCVFVALVLTGVWYGTRMHIVTLEEVTVTGGETIEHETVREAVESVLGGSYLKLIPHRFSLLYPHEALMGAVGQIARVKDVSIERDSRTLTVAFTEYVPYALWCAEALETPHCYFLDETGYAFAPGPQLDGGTLVRHFKEGEDTLEEKQVFDESSFRSLHAFLAQLTDELSLRVTDVRSTQDGDLALKVNGGGEILIQNDGRYEPVFENLVSVLSSREFDHLEAGNFKYIDLRFGNKVFVNEELEPETPGTTTEAFATSTEG